MDVYIGSIWMAGFDYAPLGWLPCNGQLLPIAQYQALYAVLGCAFGGDGRTTFALPDLRGRTPVGMGAGSGLTAYPIGERGGCEAVALSQAQVGPHSHAVATSAGGRTAQSSPAGAVPAAGTALTVYDAMPATPKTMHAGMIAPAGSQGHENRQPYQVVNYYICWEGLFPPRG